MNRRSAIPAILFVTLFAMTGCRALTLNHWRVKKELRNVDCVRFDRGNTVITDEETLEELRQVYLNSKWTFSPGEIPTGTVTMQYMAGEKEVVTLHVQGYAIFLDDTWTAFIDPQTTMRLLAITGVQSDFWDHLKSQYGF